MVLIAAGIVGKIERRKVKFLLIKNSKNEEWELPKITVRKTESSVRAALRMIGEQASIRARILDEAGRNSSVITINGKQVTQKIFYYTMIFRASSGERIGFMESAWFDYPKAYRKLTLKKEREPLSNANRSIKDWWKKRKSRPKRADSEDEADE